MNEQEVYEYKLNKFKNEFFKVYITVLGIAVLALTFVKLS
jgi:hypothetical protein